MAFTVAYESVHAEWCAVVASVVAEYAAELGAVAPAEGSGITRLTAAFNQGWLRGADLLRSDIVHRRGGYDDAQWGAFVAGYADGARFHAEATAEAARKLVAR
jgi:hypothetical protein